MKFERHIGIDYSGAQLPTTRLPGLQIYEARTGGEPERIEPPNVPDTVRNWTRCTLAAYLRETLEGTDPVVIGIDHGFSFPLAYMKRHQIKTWDSFLDDFVQHWPTDRKPVGQLIDSNQRSGNPNEFRLCEKWTPSAKSVFQFGGQGAVAHSTHAGLPWLRWLRHNVARDRVHFWPFDGFCVEDEKSVVAEVYPSLFCRRYANAPSNRDKRDAWSVANWLREMDCNHRLDRYFMPPLTQDERRQARLEGWILGVC